MAHDLEGKTINKILIAEDKQAILFKCSDGDVKALADADCCSYTWIENIDTPALGFPATVQSVRDLEMGDDIESEDGDVVTLYGIEIVTDKGAITIDFRNESNGYYGGDLVWPSGGYFYGGVCNQNISKEVWKELSEVL